jgi:acyl carrier protein
MNASDFLKQLDEILELSPGTLSGPENLDDFPLWDSTAIISFMALTDSNGTRLSPKEVAACRTVNDLLRIARVQA